METILLLENNIFCSLLILSITKRFNINIDKIVSNYDEISRYTIDFKRSKVITCKDLNAFFELNKNSDFVKFIKRIVEHYTNLYVMLRLDKHVYDNSNTLHSLTLKDHITFFEFYHDRIFEPWLNDFFNNYKDDTSEITSEILLDSFMTNINSMSFVQLTEAELKEFKIEEIRFFKDYKISIYPLFINFKSLLNAVNEKNIILKRSHNYDELGTLIWHKDSDLTIYKKLQKITNNNFSKTTRGDFCYGTLTYEFFGRDTFYDWLKALDEFKQLLKDI